MDGIASVLELRGITKTFGGVSALRGVDFILERGEIHGLVGENGAGKSTLMKIIAGAQPEFQGVMRLDGHDVRFRSPHDALKAGIGMVHQELCTAPDLSVAENVFLGRQPTTRFGNIDWGKMFAETEHHLGSLGINVNPRTRIGSLPLGLQQLIELGRVLFSGARIIILDEPTSALSPPEIERLFGVLENLRKTGTSLIFISHFLDDIIAVSNKLTVIRNGCNAGTVETSSVDKEWIIQQMIGVDREATIEASAEEVMLRGKPDAAPVLEVEELNSASLRGVTLNVAKGEVLGVYGFIGSGHSELGSVLVGKVVATQGQVRISGRPVRLSNTASTKRAGIVCLPESRRDMLFAAQPIYRNISISFLEKLSRVFVRPRTEKRIASERVADIGVTPRSVERLVGTLSGGNQQKVALARWLTHLPRVLVLNEPTRGMDVGAKQDVIFIIRKLQEKNVGIIVVSTEPETIMALADRVIVMKKGSVSREFSRELVSKRQLLAAA